MQKYFGHLANVWIFYIDSMGREGRTFDPDFPIRRKDRYKTALVRLKHKYGKEGFKPIRIEWDVWQDQSKGVRRKIVNFNPEV